MKKSRTVKKINPIAKALRSPHLRMKVVASGKVYRRPADKRAIARECIQA